MKSIAAGDLTAEIATGGSDEIADMAEALLVFKNNMLESNRLRAERAEAEKHVHAQRKNEMRKARRRIRGGGRRDRPDGLLRLD